MVEVTKLGNKTVVVDGKLIKLYKGGSFLRQMYYGGYEDFDGANDGVWVKYINIPITLVPIEYAIYRIVIDSTNVSVYNVEDSLKTQSAIASEFWNLVRLDGLDIRVFDQLYRQLWFWVEEFDYTNKKAIIWVNLPELSEELNIAFGNPKASGSSYNDPNNVFEFFDDFEVWEGWVTYGSGVVKQSSTRPYRGRFSLLKDVYCDPNGGYKSIGKTLGRNIVLEAWVNRDYNSGCDYDRVGIIDDNGNGYGFVKYDYGDQILIDKRTNYAGTTIASATAVTTNDNWYKMKLIIKEYDVIVQTIDDYGQLRRASILDTTYSTFTRVYVFGGYPYYVDDLKVIKYSDPADFGTPSIKEF